MDDAAVMATAEAVRAASMEIGEDEAPLLVGVTLYLAAAGVVQQEVVPCVAGSPAGC